MAKEAARSDDCGKACSGRSCCSLGWGNDRVSCGGGECLHGRIVEQLRSTHRDAETVVVGVSGRSVGKRASWREETAARCAIAH